jgi:tRNA-specific adenosine deaminase 3
MALALGLGSLFNHSETPNVSYTTDPFTESIRFTTTKSICAGDELCIFYGHKLWFDPVDGPQLVKEETDDEWRGLAEVGDDIGVGQSRRPPFLDGDPDEIVPVEDLPFTRFRVLQEEEEEELNAVRTSELPRTFKRS